MAYKETKRKAFNFLRSYFDVVNELEKDKDKLDFLMSIINKQFLDEDPKDLNFIVNLCYSSQKHQIESSVKGWKRVFKSEGMTDPSIDPPTNPPTLPMTDPKEEEEKEEEKEEVKEKVEYTKRETIDKFLSWFNISKKQFTGKEGKYKVLTDTDYKNLKKLKDSYNSEEFKKAIPNLFKNQWAKDTGNQSPSHFLRVENFNKYLEQGGTEDRRDWEW